MQRGNICWASLPPPEGSGPGFRRPVLVVQADEFNRSRIQTVLVAALTSNLALAQAPGNVRIKAGRTGLPRDSVVNISQVLTLDKRMLSAPIAALDRASMEDVEAGLRLVLAL